MSRGKRNNNPFNIKYNGFNRWVGLIGSDGVFCKFDTLNHGLRAGFILLRNYINKGYNTPRKIINRFAPASENNTSSYLYYVNSFVSLDDVISYPSDDFVKLCIAICIYESEYLLTKKRVYDLLNFYQI